MPDNKMGTIQLSGLISGAVLGSGIILLPPIALEKLGDWSVISWIIIMGLGAVFASLFSRLALTHPGSEGVAIAIRETFGNRMGQLASNCLISAVLVGPVAVLMTAALSVVEALSIHGHYAPAICAGLAVPCSMLLLRRVTVVGNIALAASISIGAIILGGSIVTLIQQPTSPLPTSHADPETLGSTLMILFWAIIGWEILGNYSKEVRTPEKTIPKAALLSVSTICSIYILAGWAMLAAQDTDSATIAVADIITPLFGGSSAFIIMLMTVTLCICTYLMVVGGVSRMIAAQAEKGKLPEFMAGRNNCSAPRNAILLLVCFHLADLTLLHFKIISIEEIIATANVFFITNALIAVAAAMRLSKSPLAKLLCSVLLAGFTALLMFSPAWSIILLGCLTLGTLINVSTLKIQTQRDV